LDRYENYPLGRGIRALYYEYTGNLKKADLDFKAAAKGGRLFESLYIGFLFRQHRSNEAIELYRPYTAYLYADLPDGEEQSLAKYAEMHERKDLPIQPRTWIQLNLVYAGKYELALEEWKNIAKEADYPQLYMLQYPIWLFSGEKEPHEILEHAEASGVRKQKAAANYHLGIHYVNQKQRAKAIEHFDECLRFDIFMDNVLFSAEGFLDRLDRDSSWPYRSPW
jgi:tetratricopeptide (TPR) repeat protein